MQKMEGLQDELADSDRKINELLNANEVLDSRWKQSEETSSRLAKQVECMEELQKKIVSLFTKLN
jgi:hypothetical protein